MTTNRALRIAFLWIIIVIGFVLHGGYHVSEMIYGIDIKSPKANGTVPLMAHIIRIIFEVVLLLCAFLTLYIQHKGFRKFSFGWAIVLAPLNAFHLVSTAIHEISDYSQIAVLSLILAVNIVLIFAIRHWTKEA